MKPIIRFACAALTAIILIAGLNWAVDPLQLFGPARFTRAFYTSDHRTQAAGLIRSQDFDTVYVGTSLAVHFRPSDIDKALGVKSVKLAMSGTTSPEHSFAIQTAITARHPKKVIWEMDDWIFRDAPDVDSNIYFPANLYRRNLKGVSSYLLNLDTARESTWLLFRQIKPLDDLALRLTWSGYLKYHNDNVNEIDTIPSYVDLKTIYNAPRAMASYKHYAQSPAEISAGYDYNAMVQNFDRDAIDLIRRNPEVEFTIYFPPYSILQFVVMRDASPATLDIVYRFSGYMAERMSQLPNVRLFDFRDVQAITHDLNNYADLVHHSPTIDLKVLSALATGEHEVNRAVPRASLERQKQQIEAYRLDEATY